MILLGLDVSTKFCGVVILDTEKQTDETSINHVVLFEHIEFKKCETMWDKADHVRSVFEGYKNRPEFSNVQRIYVEDAAKRFTPGMSSADTIGTLLRFNGLVSYFAHDIFHIDPEYIAVGTARKLCGIKMLSRSKCGLSQKEQTFNFMMNTELKSVTWPKKKSGNTVEWALDVVDAYVVARAGAMISKDDGSDCLTKTKSSDKVVRSRGRRS